MNNGSPLKNRPAALQLHHRLAHSHKHDEDEYKEVSPTHALSIVIQWQQDTSQEWGVLQDGLKEQFKDAGLTVNWKNVCTLEDGALFTFWEMTKKSFSQNLEAYLSKETSLLRLKEQHVTSITFHYDCTAFVSSKPFQSYIKKRGKTKFYKCSNYNAEHGSSKKRVFSLDASQTTESFSSRKSESTSVQSTHAQGNLAETVNEIPPASSSRFTTGVSDHSEHASPHLPDVPRSLKNAAVNLLTHSSQFVPLHPSLPSRPDITHVTSSASFKSYPLQHVLQPQPTNPITAVSVQLQPISIPRHSYPPSSTPQTSQTTFMPSVPTSPRKRFAASTLDYLERHESAKRIKHEESDMYNNAEVKSYGKASYHSLASTSSYNEAAEARLQEAKASQEAAEAALIHEREFRRTEKDQMKKLYRAMEEECQRLSQAKGTAQRNERSLRDHVNSLQAELREVHSALQLVQEDHEKARQREMEIHAAFEEARSAERRLADDHERLVNAERAALEAKKDSEEALRVAEERQKTAEEKQRTAEEALSSERCQRIAAEQTLLDITSVSTRVNVFARPAS